MLPKYSTYTELYSKSSLYFVIQGNNNNNNKRNTEIRQEVKTFPCLLSTKTIYPMWKDILPTWYKQSKFLLKVAIKM